MKKYFLSLFIFGICYLTFANPVSAAIGPKFGYKMTWNIENVYYYIDQSAPGYSGTIAAAAKNWVYTGCGYNKLYPNTSTTNKTNSAIDIFAASEGRNGMLAGTLMFKRVNGNATLLNPNYSAPTDNWLFAEIHINNDVFQNYSFEVRQGTMAHEFGHAFGLAHNQIANSIMGQVDVRKVQTVQQIDNDTFNSIY